MQTGMNTTIQTARDLVLIAADSPRTRVMYARAIDDYLEWAGSSEPPMSFTRESVMLWRDALIRSGLSPSTINQKLAAVRSLALEAGHNGVLDQETSQCIRQVAGVPKARVREGSWLPRRQLERLLSSPSGTTLKGLRDRVVLMLLAVCGLRRSEVSNLMLDQILRRDDRWVLDVLGKGRKRRLVPLPDDCKQMIDDWISASAISRGALVRAFDRTGTRVRWSISPEGIRKIVSGYGARIGVAIGPHDLRRTGAKQRYRHDRDLVHIQRFLGHASIRTTQEYLGLTQNLRRAACDYLGIQLSGEGKPDEE
jgi:site-specific recombinase XerD